MSRQEDPHAGDDRGPATGTVRTSGTVRDLHGDLAIRLTSLGGRTTAVVTGEVDHGCAPTLEDAIADSLASSPAGLRLDLGGLSFCDCAGLNALLRVRRLAEETGHPLELYALSPAVERLLVLTGTHVLFFPPCPGRPRPAGEHATGHVSGAASDRPPPDRARRAGRAREALTVLRRARPYTAPRTGRHHAAP
jgi:anti-anti-sigma factor